MRDMGPLFSAAGILGAALLILVTICLEFALGPAYPSAPSVIPANLEIPAGVWILASYLGSFYLLGLSIVLGIAAFSSDWLDRKAMARGSLLSLLAIPFTPLWPAVVVLAVVVWFGALVWIAFRPDRTPNPAEEMA